MNVLTAREQLRAVLNGESPPYPAPFGAAHHALKNGRPLCLASLDTVPIMRPIPCRPGGTRAVLPR